MTARAGLLATVLLLPASPAAAWTRAAGFDTGIDEPVPRAAIAADGRSAVAFQARRGLEVVTGDARGRFAAPRLLDRRGGRDWSVAVGPGGRVLVAWEQRDGIHVAVRAAAGGAFHVRRAAASTGSEINGVQAARDPRGGWVLAERVFPARTSARAAYSVRGLSLREDGRAVGKPQDLGPGFFGIDARPTNALTVDEGGRAVLAFRRESTTGGPEPVVVSVRPHGGAFSDPAPVAGPGSDPRVAAAGGAALVAFTRTVRCGDVGCFGGPAISRLSPDGTPSAPAGPSLASPGRAFAPTAALASGGAVALAFLLKDAPADFSNEAPVRAVSIGADGRVGRVQTLSARPATEPVALGLTGGRVLVLWTGARGFGAALAKPGSTFRTIRPPAGPPPAQFHTNDTNRDLRAGGRFAIVAWSRGRRVRISIQGF